MKRALSRALQSLGIVAPRDGKFTSYSLRIGAHTEQVLLGIPLEVQLGRFVWAKDSSYMASIYLD